MRRSTVVVAWALALACGRGGPGAAATPATRRDHGAQAEAADRALDSLEERLLVGQARVRFWEEMRERHESVSAVAAVNLERHADAMAHLDRRQQERVAAAPRQRRVAARLMPTAQATR